MRLAGIFAVVCIVVAARPLWAQTPQATQPLRPYRGLFGGGAGNFNQSLTLTMAFLGGYDTSVQSTFAPLPDTTASSGAPSSQLQAVKTGFEQATAGLNYSLSRSRVSVTASAGAGGTYYQVLSQTVVSYYGAVGGSFALSRRTNFSANEMVTYQPLYFSNAFPAIGAQSVGQPVLPETTGGVRLDNYVSQNGVVSLSQRLSRRVDLSFGYDRVENTFASDDGFLTQTVFGRVNVALTRYLSVWAGDGYFDSVALPRSDVAPARGELLNFGLAYNRLASLSLTRRLTLSLGVGATVVSDGHQQQLAVTGNATLHYEIGRTWTASAGYARNVGFVQFFQEPATTDTAFASLGGLISRRLQFQSSAGVSRGSVLFQGPSNGFQTYFAAASLSCGLTRTLAVGLGYSYYPYKFDAGLQLPTGVLNHTDGQSVYAFLNVWEPLFARSRRGDASR